MILRIHGEALVSLFRDFLLYVIAFGVYPCRSRAEQSLLRFYRILTIKRAMRSDVYTLKIKPNKKLLNKGTIFLKK